jgi:site-specific DNA recombinase
MFFDNTPTSAVAYCRVSSAQQEERETIQNQIDFAANYCKLNNIELTHIYKDDGITGTLPLNERPAGQELLQDAKNGKFTLVLVFKLDRLGRATRVILNAIHDLDSYGVKVRSMTEPFDTSDASGRFLLTILAGVADLERSNILQRMELGTARAAKEGKYLGGNTPYGYRVDKDGYFEPNHDIIPNINMSEVDVIQLIYDTALEGVSTVKIADRLNALGVPTLYTLRKRKSKKPNLKWLGSTVYRILKSTTYKGIHCFAKKSKHIEREVPPIISAEKWDKVQEFLSSNQVKIKGNHIKRNYLLRGIIKCEHCGRAYTGLNKGKHSYYTDNGRFHYNVYGMDTKCFGKTIRQEVVEDVVWESCLEYIRNPKLIVKPIQKEIDQSDKVKKEIALVHAKIASNDTENQRLIDLYKAGLIDLQAVSGEFEKVKDEKAFLQSELDKLEKQLHGYDFIEQVDEAIDLLELLRQKVDAPDVSFEVKRAVVETMISKITVNSSSEKGVFITIYFRFGDKKGGYLCTQFAVRKIIYT